MSSSFANAWLLLGLVLTVVACGDADGGTQTIAPVSPGTSAVPATDGTAPKASPRWEPLATFAGDGSTQTAPFNIAADAIQWRVRWRCDTGSLRISAEPPPRRPSPIVENACPGQDEGFAIHTGNIRLAIEAGGPWEAVVEQQLDSPLDESAPAGSAEASVLARGDFYEIENPGRGRATVLELADGRRVLRFEDFETLATPELFVWLTTAPNPRTSVEATEAERVELGPLRSTLGSQNYDLPAGVHLDQIRSVVIWCEPVGIAYTAAALVAGTE